MHQGAGQLCGPWCLLECPNCNSLVACKGGLAPFLAQRATTHHSKPGMVGYVAGAMLAERPCREAPLNYNPLYELPASSTAAPIWRNRILLTVCINRFLS